jgi:guanyl-specific ribonuclease Sa
MRSRKRRRKQKSGRWVLILLVTGLLAVGCGWVLNELLIQGYLWSPAVTADDPEVGNPTSEQLQPPKSNDPEPVQPTVTESRVDLPAHTFYLLQVGALSNEAGAERLVQQLADLGYPGSYAKDGVFFKVYAGIYPEREAAQAVKQLLEQQGQSAFVKEDSLPGAAYAVTGGMANYFASANDRLAAIDQAFAVCLTASSIDAAIISNLQQRVDTAHQALSALTPPTDLQPFHAAMLEACTELLATVNRIEEYLNSNDETELLKAESSLMDFAIHYQQAQSIIRNILT